MKHQIDIRINDLPDGFRQYFKRTKKLCEKKGVSMLITDKPKILMEEEGILCGGWFCSTSKTFASAMGSKFAQQIFVHESCHMDQWLEKSSLWNPRNERNYDGKPWEEMTDNQLFGHLTRYRDCEEDCERRSVQKIIDLKLDIDIHEYIRQANAYIWGYNVMMETGVWFKGGRTPYRVPEIRRIMPGFFQDDYTTTPSVVRDLMLEHCFE